MNEPLLQIQFFGVTWVITVWKLLGYLGVGLFAGRWLVQLVASHRAGRPRFPRLFWRMSLLGSVLLLGYFVFSEKNDSVGVLSNLLPCGVACYNLYLDRRHQGSRTVAIPPKSLPPPAPPAHRQASVERSGNQERAHSLS
jgi:lipid-A-disaccharide synthase-like uncharacterized protein